MKTEFDIIGIRYRKGFLLNLLRKRKIEENSINKFKSHNGCPICNFAECKVISEVDRIGMPNQTVICKQCDFVFNNSYIANPNDYYKNEFASERWQDPETSFLKRTAPEAFSSKRFEFIREKLHDKFSNIETILEIGCGDGCNLLPYHLNGKSVVGYDLNEEYLKPGRRRGMELIKGDIHSIAENHKFDLIMLIHSFEHVVDLDEMVKKVKLHLNPEGYVFVEVPGIVNWNQRKKAFKADMGLKSSNNFMGYLQYQHNYHFDKAHLNYFWEKNNFEMIYGDEWVRAIFNRKEFNTFEGKNPELQWKELNNNIFKHLIEVEKDFLVISNLISGFLKLIKRKLMSKKA